MYSPTKEWTDKHGEPNFARFGNPTKQRWICCQNTDSSCYESKCSDFDREKGCCLKNSKAPYLEGWETQVNERTGQKVLSKKYFDQAGAEMASLPQVHGTPPEMCAYKIDHEKNAKIREEYLTYIAAGGNMPWQQFHRRATQAKGVMSVATGG